MHKYNSKNLQQSNITLDKMNPLKHYNLSSQINLCKIFTILALIFSIFMVYHNLKSFICILQIKKTSYSSSLSISQPSSSPTNINHMLFTISSSINTWPGRKPYFQEWWRPNITRGYIYFDQEIQDPSGHDNLPPFRVSENTTKLKVFSTQVNPNVIRIVRMILETFREGDKDVRWFVVGDDDTIFFLDNLVRVLGRYDHTKYFYIGGVSECVKQNFDFSFEYAFGGAGFAMSYTLVEALVANLDRCVESYSFYHFADQILGSCVGDLGVPLTIEKGFHQIDLRDDISGFLSAHPQAPLISFHQLDAVAPIFPTMDRHESIQHLMVAVKVDHSRILQQTVCYHKQKNWAFSIAWGYSIYIYEQMIPRSILRRPLETFTPWNFIRQPPADYMFNTRLVTNNSCETPHIFFFRSVTNNATINETVMTYVRHKPRQLPACSSNHSADYISEIRVYSPTTKLYTEEANILRENLNVDGNREDCCDALNVDGNNTTTVRIRTCRRTEIIVS